MQGAEVFLVDGLIDDCGRLVSEGEREVGWFNCSTLREPYRIEGKKTMGIELAEQLGWELPDVIFYPTGGGTGIIGMWKAFAELEAIGWIGPKRPRMVVVQAAGCAPMVKAWEEGVGARPALGERAHLRRRHPRAAGGRRFPDPARGARERRVCDRRHRRGDRRGVARGRRRGRACCCVPKARRPMPPTNRRSPTDGSARTSGSSCSTARAGSNTRCPRPARQLKLGERDRLAKVDRSCSSSMARSSAVMRSIPKSAIRAAGIAILLCLAACSGPPWTLNQSPDGITLRWYPDETHRRGGGLGRAGALPVIGQERRADRVRPERQRPDRQISLPLIRL